MNKEQETIQLAIQLLNSTHSKLMSVYRSGAVSGSYKQLADFAESINTIKSCENLLSSLTPTSDTSFEK